MTLYMIWSFRHSEWWGPDRGGYTLRVDQAGRYTKQEAADITLNCLPGANIAVDVELSNRFAGITDPKVIEQEMDEWRRL